MKFPVEILVKTNQRKTEIVEEKDGFLLIAVHAKPKNNEVNRELIRFFSKLAGKPVKILLGLRGKKKVIG